MDLIEELLFDAFPNPERVGCPDEATLMALAQDKLLCDDPVCLHVVSCSECFAEYYSNCLELEKKTSAIKKTHFLSWSEITHAFKNDDDTLMTALNRLRERIAAYHRKLSR